MEKELIHSKEFKLSDIYDIYEKLLYLSNIKRLGSVSYNIRKFARPFKEVYDQLSAQRADMIKAYSVNGVFTQEALIECNKEINKIMTEKDTVKYGKFEPSWIFSTEVEGCSILDQFIDESITSEEKTSD